MLEHVSVCWTCDQKMYSSLISMLRAAAAASSAVAVCLFSTSLCESISDVCVVLQFQLLPSALFKSSSDFIPLGKSLVSVHTEHHVYVQIEQDLDDKAYITPTKYQHVSRVYWTYSYLIKGTQLHVSICNNAIVLSY